MSSSNSNCLLCFIELKQENLRINYPPKLPELCSKYINFIFSGETHQPNQDLPFCPRCFESAVELVNFHEQMEHYQLRICDLVLSMEILHRSRKTVSSNSKIDTVDNNSGKELTDWRKELTDSVEELTDSGKELTDLGKELTDSGKELTDSGKELTDLGKELTDSGKELTDSGKELTDSGKEPESQINKSKDWLTDNCGDSLAFPVSTNNGNNIAKDKEELQRETPQHFIICHIADTKSCAPKNGILSLESENDDDDIIFLGSDTENPDDPSISIWSQIDLERSCEIINSEKCSSSFENGLENLELSAQSGSRPAATSTFSATSLHGDQISEQSAVCMEIIELESKLESKKLKRKFKNGPARFQCNGCDKEFRHQCHLLRHHREVHEQQRPFPCDVCDKAFKKATDLTIHKRIHTGERPFSCTVCNQSFAQKSTLRNHENTHLNRRPFKCDICKLKFAMKSTMMRHRKRHGGDKPFKCDECDYTCNQRWGLKSHKKYRHSIIATFKCRECEKIFLSSIDVEDHYKSVHFALDFSDECAVILE